MSTSAPPPGPDDVAADRESSLRVAGVAHDVNQMLAVIRGRAELLLRRSPAADPHLQAIVLAAGDASTMLERLAGAAPGCAADVASSPHQALAEAALLVLPPSGAWAAATGETQGGAAWRLDNRIDPALGVRLPAAVLREVLVNLLRNAVAAMAAGGGIVAGAQVADGVVRVRVADDGPGLDPGVAARLFEPGATTSRGSRHGIGLAACRQLLATHGASLELDAATAGGAAFVIGAAAARLPAGEEAGRASRPTAAAPGLSVIVIDDEAAMREMLGDVLGELGCTVRCHRDGVGALADGALDGVVAALVDRRLAGQDGLAVAASLRERDRRLVIVLMSGWDRDEMPAPGGLVDFTVRKPLALDTLQDLLARAAALHGERGGQGSRA